MWVPEPQSRVLGGLDAPGGPGAGAPSDPVLFPPSLALRAEAAGGGAGPTCDPGSPPGNPLRRVCWAAFQGVPARLCTARGASGTRVSSEAGDGQRAEAMRRKQAPRSTPTESGDQAGNTNPFPSNQSNPSNPGLTPQAKAGRGSWDCSCSLIGKEPRPCSSSCGVQGCGGGCRGSGGVGRPSDLASWALARAADQLPAGTSETKG